MSTTIGSLQRAMRDALRTATDEASLDARSLLAHALGVSVDDLFARADDAVDDEMIVSAMAFVARRVGGEPVARIVGRRGFYGFDLELGPATLEPRPDTESLVDVALSVVDAGRGRESPLRVLDLGTGTGAILLALAHALPHMWGVGVDLSGDALDVARANARRLGVDERLRFVASNWAMPIRAQFDLVVSNPPYVRSADMAGLQREVRDYDPPLALDGGQDGLQAYRAIIPELARIIAADGVALFEAGFDQAGDVVAIAQAAGWEAEVHRDLARLDRVVHLSRGQQRHA